MIFRNIKEKLRRSGLLPKIVNYYDRTYIEWRRRNWLLWKQWRQNETYRRNLLIFYYACVFIIAAIFLLFLGKEWHRLLGGG